MTKSAIIFVLITIAALVLTSPISPRNCASKRIEAAGVNIHDVGDVTGNQIHKADQDNSEDESSDCSESSEEQSIGLVQPTREPQQEFAYQPAILTSVPSYQGYQRYPNLEALGGMSMTNYKEVLYPYVHPKLLAEYNAGFTVNSLPPVVATYIHGLIPQEEIQRTRYDLDVLSQSPFLPSLARPSRMLRTTEEDFLAELQHDAIMNNILPTMQVPFARYAAPAPYNPAPPTSGPLSGGISAVFPNAGAGGCAQPILFSCTPKVIRGFLRPVGPADYQTPAYRQEPEHNPTSEKHATPVKVNLEPVIVKDVVKPKSGK